MNERERVAALRRLFAEAGDDASRAAVLVGIGDDAALLAVEGASRRLIATVDEQVENTHFRLGWLSLEDLGYRATMAAASDVAAMGGEVLTLLSSLVLPRNFPDDDLLAIARGQARAATELGAAMAGGNLARGPALSVGTTVLGTVAGPGVRRDGARAGDHLWLAGPVGRAAAGLAILATLSEEIATEEGAVGVAARVCLDAWRRPSARVPEGLAAARLGATALIDISDGLAADAAQIAKASGLRLVLDARSLLADATLRTVAARLSREPLSLVLGGGEDYALLAAVPPDVSLPGFVRIGHCEAGAAEVTVERIDGTREAPPAGFDHFR